MENAGILVQDPSDLCIPIPFIDDWDCHFDYLHLAYWYV
jgi:hypothetical protein